MNVMLGVAFAALIIAAALVQFWPVIAALSGGSAAFLGALVGAAAGLGAILGGALYNAKLNRDENKRLRAEEGRALALALRGEMLSVADTFRRHKMTWSGELEEHADDAEDKAVHLCMEVACSTAIFSKCSDRLGLLEDPELIADLAQFYPGLPTEIEFADKSVRYLREVFQSRKELDDTIMKRAATLAEKLKRAADLLAPRP